MHSHSLFRGYLTVSRQADKNQLFIRRSVGNRTSCLSYLQDSYVSISLELRQQQSLVLQALQGQLLLLHQLLASGLQHAGRPLIDGPALDDQVKQQTTGSCRHCRASLFSSISSLVTFSRPSDHSTLSQVLAIT